jgi:hypothetical protein
MGATSFKAYMQITRAELGAAIDEAHKRGLKVTGHLCSVTLAEAADLPRLLEQRAAALATVHGPMSATSPGHHEGKAGAVRITLGIDPAASAVIETYRVR